MPHWSTSAIASLFVLSSIVSQGKADVKALPCQNNEVRIAQELLLQVISGGTDIQPASNPCLNPKNPVYRLTRVNHANPSETPDPREAARVTVSDRSRIVQLQALGPDHWEAKFEIQPENAPLIRDRFTFLVHLSPLLSRTLKCGDIVDLPTQRFLRPSKSEECPKLPELSHSLQKH